MLVALEKKIPDSHVKVRIIRVRVYKDTSQPERNTYKFCTNVVYHMLGNLEEGKMIRVSEFWPKPCFLVL